MVAVFYILHRDWSREEADPTTEKREVEREREDRKRQKRIVKDSKRKEKVREREREATLCTTDPPAAARVDLPNDAKVQTE